MVWFITLTYPIHQADFPASKMDHPSSYDYGGGGNGGIGDGGHGGDSGGDGGGGD